MSDKLVVVYPSEKYDTERMTRKEILAGNPWWKKIIDSMKGSLQAFCNAFTETDLYAIVEMPDNVSAAAFALTIAASGAVTLKTTVLMTPEEIDKAVKKPPSYRPPGK